MRHIPLILIFLMIIFAGCHFTWKALAHPGRDEFIIEPIGPSIESLNQKEGIPIKNSEMLFGEKVETGFKHLTDKQIIKIEGLKEFLKLNPSLIFGGWIVKECKASRIYWIVNEDALYYYYPKQRHKIEKKSALSPRTLMSVRHKSDNRFWVVVLIIVEVIVGIVALYWVDRKIFGREEW